MSASEKRVAKSGDQLAVGDWLAPEELADGAVEVLHTLTYPGDGYTGVHLVLREQGNVKPFSDVVSGSTLFELATDAELATLREKAQRAQRIADIRAFADWLEARPWAPVPGSLTAMVHLHGDDAIARVRQFGEDANLKVSDRLDDRTEVDASLPSVTYSVIAWHRSGRPAEPERDGPWFEVGDPVYPRSGGEVVTVTEVAPIAGSSPVRQQFQANGVAIWRHSDGYQARPADPTGLDYSRPADDPQPSAGRVPPHFEDARTGAVVEADHNCGPGCPSPCPQDDDDPRGWRG